MKWEQYIDTYFFTDSYGTYLADFFEKYLYGHNDLEKLVHFLQYIKNGNTNIYLIQKFLLLKVFILELDFSNFVYQ